MSEAPPLRLQRSFAAPPEAVFDAWTNPRLLERWWAAGRTWQTPLAEVDLRVGGRYRLSMRDPDRNVVHTVAGEYREVRRPRRLVYTWRWEGDDGGGESIVSVDFVPDGEGTTVMLSHAGLRSDDARQHHGGWSGCLENLQTRVFGARVGGTA